MYINKDLFYKKHGVDLELFQSGIVAVKIKSPYSSDINPVTLKTEKTYYARSVYGGYDLYDDQGEKVDYIKSSTGDAARVARSIYDDTEECED